MSSQQADTPTEERLSEAQALRQVAALARRSLVSTYRQPALWFPGLFFPLVIAAVNSGSLERSTGLPGFPDVDSYLQFVLPATVIQGVLFGGILAGTDVALDVQDGFFDRLLTSPVSRTSIVVGRLVGSAVLGLLQSIIFVVVFSIFGVRIPGGLAAVSVLAVTAVLLAVAVGGLAAAVGLRTGQQEAVQNSFPLVFIVLFMSSAFFPAQLMSGWFGAMARNNPLTWMIDAVRSVVVDGFAVDDAFVAFGVALCAAVAAVVVALRQLAWRLRVAP
ncbi:MAG: hypothetical protein KatS3mg008_1899 [Acidimicrobiales bacterium]|nr:MAG: hypothetical protein KatS3mg008_1899 [Acidimicrobiales bacterium]